VRNEELRWKQRVDREERSERKEAHGSGNRRGLSGCKTIGRWQPSIVLRVVVGFRRFVAASASGKEDLAGVETAKCAGVSAQGWAVP